MKSKEKKFLLILIIVSILIIIMEQLFLNIVNASYYEQQTEENKKIIGLSDVSGEGVIIYINDGSDLIHQEDVIILLDELKNAGAEAISVNDQRVTINTYIYCDGGVILIDGQKIGNPFTIKAIGDSKTIYGSIMRNKGYISTLKNDGIKIDVDISSNITILKTNKKISKKLEKINNSAKDYKITSQIVGKEKITGKGIEIYIDTSNEKDITALTLIQLVNYLNSAGVEAISINGNRITTMTDMMDISGKYILIDSVPVKSPYLIKVVGNVKKICEVLDYENSTINKLIESGKEVSAYSKFFISVDQYMETRGKNKLNISYIK